MSPAPQHISFNGNAPDVDPAAWIAPTATLIGAVTIGARTGVYYGAVVRGDSSTIVIGAGANADLSVAWLGRQAAALAGPGGEVVLAAVLVVPMAQPLGAALEGPAAAACEVLERAEREFEGAFEFDTRLVRVRGFAEGVLQLLDSEPFDLVEIVG